MNRTVLQIPLIFETFPQMLFYVDLLVHHILCIKQMDTLSSISDIGPFCS